MPLIKDTEIIDGQEITIYVEVAEIDSSANRYGDEQGGTLGGDTDRVLDMARDIFGDGLVLAHNCAVRVVDSIKKMDRSIRPDEFEIQLAIKLDAEVGAILARIGAEAQLQVTMTWSHRDQM